MFEIHGLAVGDRVTVQYQGKSYESVVQDIPHPDTVVISHPSNRGIFLNVADGENAEVCFVQDNGIYSFQASQGNRRVVDNVPLLTLTAASEVTRKQRRSFFRLNKALPVMVAVKKEGDHEKTVTYRAQAINISGSGIKLAIRQPLNTNERVECKILLSHDIEVVLDGKVVWSEKTDSLNHTNHVGIHFTIQDEVTQRTLVRYITIEQRKQLKSDR